MDILKLLENLIERRALGTFTVKKHKHFREVFVEEESVYLVGENFCGKIALDDLLAKVVLGKRLSLAKLETIILSTDLKKQSLPEVLHAQGLLEEEDLKNLGRAQLLEETIDLFFRNSASIHFQERRVPEQLLTSESIVARTPIPLRTVLDELRRRDEAAAAFEVLIPSEDEVFVITEMGMAHKQQKEHDFVTQRIFDLIDGFRDLRSIVEDSYFFEFRILSVIAASLERGFLKKTIHPELKGISTQTLTRAEAERNLPLFKNAVKYGVDELAARERLAVVYEQLGSVDDAVIQYNFIGDALYRMRKSPKAIKAYQRALALKPGEALITDKICKIYLNAAEEEIARGDTAVATQLLEGALKARPGDLAVFKRLAQVFVAEKKMKEISDLCDVAIAEAARKRSAQSGIAACKLIIALVPHNPAFRKKLINLYLDFGLEDDAAAEMESLSRLYSQQGHESKALEVAGKSQRLGVGENPARRSRAAVAMLGKRASRTRHQKRELRLFIFFLALLAFYQGWSKVIWDGLHDHGNTALALSTADGQEPHLRPGPGEDSLREFIAHTGYFLKQFPASYFRAAAEDLKFLASDRAKELAAARNLRKRQILDEAARLYRQDGGQRDAEVRLQEILKLDPQDSYRREAEALLGAIRRAGQASAADLVKESAAFEKQGKWEEAYRNLRQLLNAYPDSETARNLELPILIDSFPGGAEVREAGKAADAPSLGRTPLPVRIKPGSSRALELRLRGHYPLRREVYEPKKPKTPNYRRRFLLLQEPLWETTLDAPLAVPPTLASGLLCGGTRGGAVFCLDLEGTVTSWARSGDGAENLVLPPLVTEDGIVTIWNDKKVLRLKTGHDTGEDLTLQPDAELVLENLAAPPTCSLRDGSFFVMSTTRKKLQGLPLSALGKGEASGGWVLDLAETPTALAAAGSSGGGAGDFIVGTEGGHVLRVSGAPPRTAWSRKLGSHAVVDLMVIGDRVAALTRNKEVFLLTLADGAGVGGFSPDGNPWLCFAPQAGKIFALDDEGKLVELAAETGAVATPSDPAIEGLLTLPPTGLIAAGGALALLHDGGHGLLVVDPRKPGPPRLRWGTRTTSRIRHVVASDGWSVVATEKGTIGLYRTPE